MRVQNEASTTNTPGRIAIDPHSPAEIRCNQVVRNLDAFHDAFDVTEENAMWLREEDRVTIW